MHSFTSCHLHVVFSAKERRRLIPPELLNGNSSKWIHETFAALRGFAWQEDYGAFSIGVAGVGDTIKYIQSQAEHHRTRTFKEEFVAFLSRNDPVARLRK